LERPLLVLLSLPMMMMTARPQPLLQKMTRQAVQVAQVAQAAQAAQAAPDNPVP
jgi:hypothetical protein